jgi:hypothetical protein
VHMCCLLERGCAYVDMDEAVELVCHEAHHC